MSAIRTDPVDAGRSGVLRRLLRNPLALAALAVLLFLVLVAVFSPWLQPSSPTHVVLAYTNKEPFGRDYFLGGDQYGRDILSRLIAATPGVIESVLILLGVALVVGVPTGLVAGYFGKVFDVVGSWIFSVLIASPVIIVLIALYSVVGASQNVAMVALGVLVSPGLFWLVRQMTRLVKNELYVDAARVSGLSNVRILGRHVLLAIRGPVVISASFLAAGATAVQAALQFLGLGDQLTPSWGGMLNNAFNNVYVAPVQLLWPGLALGVVIAAFVMLGNALRDALEGTYVKPSARARRREIQGLLGEKAVEKTPDLPVDPATRAGSHREDYAGETEAPLLEIQGLQIAYAADGRLTTVVDRVSLRVEDGEIVGLVGESGSGKTQTIFAALGLLPDEAVVAGGSIRVLGTEILGRSDKELASIRGPQVAYVPQEPMSNLDPNFTIGAQLVYGIRAQRHVSRSAAKQLALSMLERVGINDPARVYRSYPHEISGGMAQRVLIAGAVACKPALLIADEPTTALDVTVQAEVLDLLRELQKEIGMGVLIVTHSFGVVADLCDRVTVMHAGRVVEQASVPAVFHAPQHDYTRRLLESILDEGSVRPERVSRMPEPPLLEISGLAVGYRHNRRAARVLEDIGLTIAPGETLGLVGESGSGKTTLGRAVLGLVPVAGGSIRFDGKDITALHASARRLLAREVQVVFQDPFTSLNPSMLIRNILAEPLIAQGAPRRSADARIRELLERVGLPDNAADRYPREFSGGQRQRIAIARALALDPRLIVCDEPVSALDLSTQLRVLDLFIEIQETTGVAYLFISHDLAVIRHISHRVAVMHRGEIVELGDVRQVTNHPIHPHTQRLWSADMVADPGEQSKRRQRRLEVAAESAGIAR